MFRYALKQLRSDWLRSILTLFGIAAVISVILVLEGFEQGVYAQLRTSVLARGGDLIASQAGFEKSGKPLCRRESLRPEIKRTSSTGSGVMTTLK